MSEYFSFVGAAFVAVLPASGDTPRWSVQVDATTRPLNGTDRFERSIRARAWTMELDLWVEPSDTAATDFAALELAYALGTVSALTLPGEPPAPPLAALILTFEVRPQRGGIDGYRGKATFGLPGGAS